MTLQAESAAPCVDVAEPQRADPSRTPLRRRWYGKVALLVLSAVLVSLAFAPLGQFYLAWVGLVPLLIVVREARSSGTAFLWGWLGGCVFFYLNLTYLLLVTIPGALALPPYLALYWGLAAAIVRGVRLLDPEPPALWKPLAVGAVWTAAEYLRGIVFTGLPWLFIGYTQSPVLALCQIADVTGIYGVTFLVVLINALVVLTLADANRRRWSLAWAGTAILLLVCVGYGVFRMSQRSPLRKGPSVVLVQPNQRDFLEKGALEKQQASVEWHVEQTTAALQRHGRADLIVWSETTMPALNQEVRDELRNSPVGQLSERTHRGIGALARLNEASLLVGGYHVDYEMIDGRRVPVGMRNSAFFYDRGGLQAARYDKIHLVPFGEFIPGKESWPRFYKLFLWLSPYSEEYSVTGGAEDALTVFDLSTTAGGSSRFVAPICFDDIDPALVARMFRGTGLQRGEKRADFIVNLTNDGWFRWGQQPQHLQHALFRSIETRAPTARAVNTGISGFIDSCGRVTGALPVGVEGTLHGTLTLDRRVSFYVRFGDLFATACVFASMVIILLPLIRMRGARR